MKALKIFHKMVTGSFSQAAIIPKALAVVTFIFPIKIKMVSGAKQKTWVELLIQMHGKLPLLYRLIKEICISRAPDRVAWAALIFGYRTEQKMVGGKSLKT